MALVFREAGDSASQNQAPEGPRCAPGNQRLSLSWVGKWRVGRPRLWPPRQKEPTQERQGACLPASCTAPRQPVRQRWGSSTQLQGVQAWPAGSGAAVPAPHPAPHPGPHPGHGSLFALGSGRWMGCQCLPSPPDGSEDRQAWGERLQKVTRGSVLGRRCAGEGWGDARAPAPLFPPPSVHQTGGGPDKVLRPLVAQK